LSLLRVSVLFLLFLFAARCTEARAQSDATPLNLPSQIGGRIAQCWKAPRTGPGQIIEVTVRLRFSSAGFVTGEPRVVYIRPPAGPDLREKIAASILAAVRACTPLPFTPALGAAIAGRMLAIRFRSLAAPGKRQAV
jgi:hypothetical protein